MIKLYTFLVFVAIFTIILYSVFVMSNPDFVKKTDLLIVPKTLIGATNMDNTINDMVFVANSKMKNDAYLNKYNAEIKIENIIQHDIMSVHVFAHSKQDVETINNTVILNIVKNIKKYYLIDEDFSITIIQTTNTTKTDVAVFAPYIVMITVAVGLIAGVLLLFYMIDVMREHNDYDENIDGEKIFAQYKNQKTQEEADISIEQEDINENMNNEYIELDNNDKEESIDSDDIENIISSKQNELQIETSTTHTVVPEGLPTTPGNLPVVDVSDFGIETENSTDKITPTQEDREAGKAEPTEEELKARLNELLNGKL